MLLIAPWLIDFPLKLDNGQLFLSLGTIDYANVVENEAHFVLECPLHNPIGEKFKSLFEKVVLGSLKYFIQLHHQVDTVEPL